MFNVLNQVGERKPKVMVADFRRWHFSSADSVAAQNPADILVLRFVGSDDGGKTPGPHLPAPSFLPGWHLPAPTPSILGRHFLHLCIIFQSWPVSMATVRLKDDQRAGGKSRRRGSSETSRWWCVSLTSPSSSLDRTITDTPIQGGWRLLPY